MFINGQLNDWVLKGAVIQMISHGFVSAAMFMCIGVMYDRLHTRNIADYNGVVNVMPKFAAFMMLFAMANAGLPATSSFVGEFMVIMGAVKVNFWVGALAALTLIYGASYSSSTITTVTRRGSPIGPSPMNQDRWRSLS